MPFPAKLKDRYEIREVLGQGGMGVVYKAFDTLVRRDVALKTLRDASDQFPLQLFYKECDVLASMSHPNIVEIFDIGDFEEDGVKKPFFVMPLLPGITLDNLIKSSSQRLTVDRAVEIIVQTCRGLQAAHERGLVHRDLKPSNIFVMEDDSVKIIDFGVAHMADSLTTRGQKGTLLYMAPEQLELKPVSALSDIFSLGVVAYETLTRRRPFSAPNETEIARAILYQIPPPVSDLNPAVNQSIARVIHKAMAKQPWQRFSTAREFGETLLKAQRNEPIETFDSTRIQPRIQRAQKAFDQNDFQFATEILGELEAEGHLDPAISQLRRQIDQSIRQKTLGQLLESARTRFEEDEYPLAMQKVQEALQLDPENAAALGLKNSIEAARSERKIDDWFRLAHQHIDNHAYTHAREALQNVLQIRPNEGRALQMLAEVDRREQQYVRKRKQKVDLYQSARDAWQHGEVSTALSKLERVLELDQSAPDTSEAGATYQNFYNQVRTEQTAIKNAYDEARAQLEKRNFAPALAICNDYLTRYPGHALFQAMKFDIEERERQELSSQIAEIDRRVDAEPDLERKVSILKEAFEQYPDEPHFERALRLVRDKRDLVNSIVAKSRLYEEREQYAEALAQLEILETIYSQYPGLSFEKEKLAKRRDQKSRSDARAHWVEQIDSHLESADYVRAADLLEHAKQEFPDDTELTHLEELTRQGMDQAREAHSLMEQGREFCSQGRVEEGVAMLRRANQLDERNPIIRNLLLNILVEQARAMLDKDWKAAGALIQEALAMDPDFSSAKGLRTLVADREREEYVNACVAEARRAQAAGDLKSAIAEVQRGIAAYPRELRLSQLHATLSKALVEAQRKTMVRESANSAVQKEPAVPEMAALAAQAPVSAPPPAPAAPAVQGGPSPIFSPPQEQETILTPSAALKAESESARLRQLEEIQRISEQAATISSLPALQSMLAKAREIAAQYPGDVDFQASSTEIELRLQFLQMIAGKERQPAVVPPQPGAPAPPRPVVPVAKPILAAQPPQPGVAAPQKSRAKLLLAAGIAAVLVLFGIIAVVLVKRNAKPVLSTIAVEIRTTPTGAVIRIDNNERGTSNLRIELPPGAHQVEALKDGYEHGVVTLNVQPGSPASADLALRPLAPTVRLFTDMAAGKALMDGNPAGELQDGQLALESVPAGKHTLKLSGRAGDVTIAFESTPAALPRISGPVEAKGVTAVLVSNLGTQIRVMCSCAPVKASVDDKPAGDIGPSGLDLNNLTPGPHQLTLGEGKDQKKVILEVGPAPTLTVFLNSNRDVGTLVVMTGEDGVKVFLNGKEMRKATERGELRIPNLDTKEYTLHIAKEGFQPEPDQRIQVRKGEETKVQFQLRAIPVVAALAIHGDATLAGAQVLLDKNPVGAVKPDGTLSANNLSPGDHTIEIRKQNFKPKQLSRHFKAGDTVQLSGTDLALEPVPVQAAAQPSKSVIVTPAPAKSQVSASAGMADWEDPGSWKQENNWYVRKGGKFVLLRTTPLSGSVVFTGSRRKGHRMQWVVHYIDEKNYELFQLDDKNYYHDRIENGKTKHLEKVALQTKAPYRSMAIEITPNSIVHKLNEGDKWIALENYSGGGNLTTGKFGFYLPGSDEVAVSNFSYTPK